MAKVPGLPVVGYAPSQDDDAIKLVNEGKILEERVLRYADKLKTMSLSVDQRRVAIGVTDIEKGFSSLFKSVFAPQGSRMPLPEDLVASADKD